MKYYSQEINRYFQDKRQEELVQIAESRHTLQYEQLCRLINFSCMRTLGDHLTAAVLVTGPSSSGKTTFSKRLSALMEKEGYQCTVISVDDYYLSREEIHKKQNNPKKPDYERLEAFDIAFFQEQMSRFLNGESIPLPRYDFTLGKRVESGVTLHPSKKDLLIIEGIHALNPKLIEGLQFARTIGVYICPFDSYVVEGMGEISSKEIRLMRRALRDAVHRASPISKTLDMWPDVRNGEEKYIKPMKIYADFFFNSSFEYEICILKSRIEDLIKSMDDSELQKLEKFLPLHLFKNFHFCKEIQIPSNSIFNEFYK